MNGSSELGPVGPEDYEAIRLMGIGAAALDLWRRRGDPGHQQRNVEFSRANSAGDVVGGLLYLAESGWLKALEEDESRYLDHLQAWQMAASVAEAVAPVAEEETQ